jgi:hypothetical protein
LKSCSIGIADSLGQINIINRFKGEKGLFYFEGLMYSVFYMCNVQKLLIYITYLQYLLEIDLPNSWQDFLPMPNLNLFLHRYILKFNKNGSVLYLFYNFFIYLHCKVCLYSYLSNKRVGYNKRVG